MQTHISLEYLTIKYKVERVKQYLPYIMLGRWLSSYFQQEIFSWLFTSR